MIKKGKASSMEKKRIKPAVINNKKKETQQKPKQLSGKTVEKKKKVGMNIPSESGMTNSSIEAKSQRDRIHLTKQRKDKASGAKSTNSRSAKSNKSKEYENTLNKLTEDNEIEKEKEKEKEFDFFNFRFSNDTKKTKEKEKEKDKNKEVKKKENDGLYEDRDDSGEEENKDDIIHRTLYRTSLEHKGLNIDKSSEKSKEKKIEKPKEISDNKFSISMEKTDDIRYNIGDKKIYSNINNDKPKKPMVFLSERAIDFYVIDADDKEHIVVSTKLKKKIDRRRNKFKEINIEKYDTSTPIRNERFSGFVLIRKTRGKKIYDLELEDNIENINTILEHRNIMINNEVIQIIPLTRLLEYKNAEKNYNDKIFKLQSELNKKEINKEREKEKERERERDNKERERDTKELKEKEKQISFLKVKNDELASLVKTQEQQIIQYERELKQTKAQVDKLKEQHQSLEKENKSLADQVESYKLKKKVVQLQLDENNDQKNIKEMKERIKKYKDELRKQPPLDAPFNLPARETDQKKKEDQNKKHLQKEEEEDEDEDNLNIDIGESGDPKKKKMKKALVRFKKKYHDVIKEEKKMAQQRE